MFQTLIPNAATFFVALIVFTVIGAVLVKIIRDTLHHKSSCGACSGCNGCPAGQKSQSQVGKHEGLL